jgi:DNA-binding CsgD family transcriptional regulator
VARRRLYLVGHGGSSWRDPRNWSREEGGQPLHHLHARGNDVVVVCHVEGHEQLDLRGMPTAGLELRGYTGRLRLPDGGRITLAAPASRTARVRARLRREVRPVIPAAFRGAVEAAGGWRRTVRDGLALLTQSRRGMVLTPRLEGAAVTRFWVGGTGTWDNSSTAHWSATTGGASGASAPTASDTANFDANSGLTAGGTITIASTAAAAAIVYGTGGTSKTQIWSLSGNPTFGTIVFGGPSQGGANRLLIQSDTVGTQRTITASHYTINGDIDFWDMNLAYSGSALWTNITGSFIGDCGGNAGAVTTNATTSATQTATGTASFTWSTHGWTSRAPLPQDDVIISNAFVAGRTVTMDMPRMGRSISCTCTGSPILNFSVAGSCFGDFKLATGMTTSGSQNLFLRGRGGITLTTNAVSILQALVIQCVGGTLTLADNVTIGAVNATCWNFASGTLAAGTTTIAITDTTAAHTFAGGGQTYGTVQYKPTGANNFTITGSNTFATLDLECTTARTVTLPASGTQTVTGAITLQGASGQNLSLVSSSPGTSTTIIVRAGATVTRSFYSFSADIIFDYQFAIALAGSSALTATIHPYQLFTPIFAGSSALAATVTPYQRINPTLAGSSTLTATLVPYRRFTAAIAGTSGLTATLVPYQEIAATLAGRSSLTAALTPYQRIVAALAGSSSMTPMLTPYQRIVLALAGTSALDATLTPYQEILAALAGTSSLSATVTPYQEIVAALAGSSSLTAILTEYQQITALLAGESSLTATLTPLQEIILDLAGRSALTATLTPYQRIAAQLAGASALDAALTPYQEIAAVLAGTSSLAADLSLLRRFAVTFAGTSALEATLEEYQRIALVLAGTSSLEADLSVPLGGIHVDLAGRSSLAATLDTYLRFLAVLAGHSALAAGLVPFQAGFVIGEVIADAAGISSVEQTVATESAVLLSASGEIVDVPGGTIPRG